VRLWETETGREVRRYEGHAGQVYSAVFSPDGRHIVTASEDRMARLWETETGREVRRCEGHSSAVWFATLSPGGRQVLTASEDGTARLWETETGREVRRFEGHPAGVTYACFSPDGLDVLTATASEDGTARLWDVGTGRGVVRYEGRSSAALCAAFSPDGRHFVTASRSGTVHLWDGATGRVVDHYLGHTADVYVAAFSPDGRYLLTTSIDRTSRLWESGTGREVRRYAGPSAGANPAVFSPDGRHVLSAAAGGAAILWDMESGQEVRRYEGHAGNVTALAFSADGRQLLAWSEDGAHLFETATGREVQRYDGLAGESATHVAFAPDGLHFLTVHADRTMRLRDIEAGEEVRCLRGHARVICSAVFSPDGRQILTASWDGTARLWDVETGRETSRFEGTGTAFASATFSPDGRHVLTTGWDSKSRLWETETGREVCSLIDFRDGTWAVVDPAGRYDASDGGDVEGLHWVVGDEPIALAQLKDRYYDPGLLAKHMGFNREVLREVAAFEAPKLFAAAEVTAPTAKDSHLRIKLTERGGGIGKVVVLVNGKEVTADARDGAVAPDAKEASLSLDLAADPRLKPGEANTIEVYAYNAEGYLRSRGLRVEYTPVGEAAPPPAMWAIVCGVSDYRGDAIDLRYAGKDAADFATALKLAAEGLLGAERVHVSLLVTEPVEGATRPTRENLAKAFESARAASPDDLLVVYLSGHGVNFGGQDGDFHYLLADAAGTDLTDPEVRKQATVSSAELTEWIKAIPATKRQVLILDTCASGKAIEKLSERREIPGSQVRALDRLKDRTGVFVLAGCAGDRVSYEASRYGQGLLTYSLLLGMRGAALREESYVDVGLLFAFAADTVPDLAKDIGGIQRPVLAQPKGGASFDIGKLTAAARAQVPLQAAKPVFVRSTFQDERRPRDLLNLGPAVEEALRADSSVIFVDARAMAGAFEITGRYDLGGGTTAVHVTVWRDEEEVAAFTVEGPEADVAGLAARIAEEVRTCAPR
jgi:WD40 repeat protein